MRHAAIGLLVLAAAGCNSVSVGNDNPTGTVGGILLDASTDGPLASANVRLVSGSQTLTATSNSDGIFQFTKVPAGTFIITFSAMGFVDVTLNTSLDGAAGNFPVNNPVRTIGPLALLPNDGTFQVQLVNDNGGAASGIEAQLRTNLRYFDESGAYFQPAGAFAATATSDMNGTVTFTNIPNFNKFRHHIQAQFFNGTQTIEVSIAPQKVAGAVPYDFLGVIVDYNALTDPTTTGTSTPVINLAGPTTGLAVVDSNLDALQPGTGVFQQVSAYKPLPAAGPIAVAFNQAIDPNTVRVQFFDEDGKASTVAGSATVNINILTITPMSPFPAGARMNIEFHAIAAQGNHQTRQFDSPRLPFFIQGTGTTSIVSAKINGTSIDVAFNEPIGPGPLYAAPNIVPCVAFFEAPANLDGAAASPIPNYPGEYVANLGSLSCLSYGAFPGLNVPMTPPAGNITLFQPLETGPITGFSTKWRVPTVDTSTCALPANALCITPLNTTSPAIKIHPVFSRLPASMTMHRVDGSNLPDTLSHDVTP